MIYKQTHEGVRDEMRFDVFTLSSSSALTNENSPSSLRQTLLRGLKSALEVDLGSVRENEKSTAVKFPRLSTGSNRLS